MGNAIPAGPVINSVSVWCAKRLRKQINPHANDEKETRRRKKERKEGKKESEREGGVCETVSWWRDEEKNTEET